MFEISFLQDKYIFPDEVKEYGEYLKKIQIMSENMQELFFEDIKKGNPVYRTAQETDRLDEEFKKSIKIVVSDLCKKGVFDYSEEVLLKGNAGYKMYENVIQEHRNNALRNMKDSLDNLLSGIEYAESAYNNVTGSGVGLISNSVTSHLAFSVFESCTVERQLNDARNTYKERIRQSCKDTDVELDKADEKYLWDVRVPQTIEVIQSFCENLLNQYMDILDGAGILNKELLDAFDIEKSRSLISNLQYCDTPILILKEAFKCFPFNINVYKKLIEYNLLGDNEWETIKIIGLDERIKKEMLQKIENEYSNKSDIKEIFDSIVSIYDYLPSELQTQINIEKCLAPIYVELKSRYLKAKNVIQSHDNLLCWIEENVSCDIENIPVEKVNEYVERYADCVIPEHIYSGLQNLKLPNNKTEWLNGGEFLTVKGEFCNCLSTQMLSFIDEVEKKKFAFMEAERKYKEKIEGLDSEIAHISSKIDSTGMLALRKRSELKKLIKQLENEKNTCLEFHTMENCKNEYEELFARTM